MTRRLALLVFAGAVFLTIMTIILSSFAHMNLNTSLLIVCAATTISLILMAVGYAFALLEARREASHKSS